MFKNSPMITLCCVILLNVIGTARAETLNDCLLENLKGVSSDVAAKAIENACKEKFSGNTPSNTNEVNNAIKQKDEIILTLNKKLFSSKIQQYQIPVPKGKWQKIGERKDHKVQPPMFTEIWVNVKNGVVHHMFYVNYNKSSNQHGWNTNKTCNRKNLHFVKNLEKNLAGKKQSCFLVNHLRLTGGKDTNPAIKQSKEWAKTNNVKIPSTVVSHRHHFAYKKYLNFWIGYNPEVDGFPESIDASWDSNDWHQDRVVGDQKREAYIAKMISLGEKTHAEVSPQFDFR